MELSKLQKEVSDWSIRNFGDDPAHRLRPLLGAIEEIGELAAIVALEASVSEDSRKSDEAMAAVFVSQALLGRLGHRILKAAQGIRGKSSEGLGQLFYELDCLCARLEAICTIAGVSSVLGEGPRSLEQTVDERADAVGDIIIYLADYCRRNGIDLSDAVLLTWEKVAKRDWQNDPQRGGEP